MIKYIGSKRRLIAALTDVTRAVRPTTALDLFSGTTRVAQAMKARGVSVTAVDSAYFAWILARCYVATDRAASDEAELRAIVKYLNELPGSPGYVTDVFCHQARYFQPQNGARIDAIRAEIAKWEGRPEFPMLLTALIEAADRVDSTTGLQMAYLKQWAPRSYLDLELRVPILTTGPGQALLGDATTIAPQLPAVDLAYLDPPYNQHRYVSNYHVWETLARGDKPEHYGIACKRLDLRSKEGRSPFNSKRTFGAAMAALLEDLAAGFVVVSYNDESWVSRAELARWLYAAGHDRVENVGFESTRYVGAQIGIHNPEGQKVGTVGRRRNIEWLFLAGAADVVGDAVAACEAHGGRLLDPALIP